MCEMTHVSSPQNVTEYNIAVLILQPTMYTQLNKEVGVVSD